MNGWRSAGLVLAGLFALISIFYQEGVLYLGGLWSQFEDGSYGHGFLVLALALYLLFTRRAALRAQAVSPDGRGLAAIAGCVLAWLAAALADIQVVQAVVLLPLVLSVLWTLAGGRVTGVVLFPILFIVFALPVWSPLLPLLRALTAAGAFFLVKMAGVTAYMQDYVVQLPAGQLSVENACSGLNYLLAALTLGTFHAWQNYGSRCSRLLVVAVAACAALLANILRVAVIIILAYETDMQHPYVRDHVMLGWYLFGSLVLVLLLADHLFYRRRAAGPPVGGVAGYREGRVGRGNAAPLRSVLLPAVAVLLLAGPAAAWWLKQHAVAMPVATLAGPPGRSGWTGPESLNDSWQPVYHGATQLRSGYHKRGMHVLLYVGYYPEQRQGGELINELNSIGGPDWRQTATRRVVARSGARMIEAELIDAGNRRRLVWYRYRVAGYNATGGYLAKALQVLALLQGRQDGAVVALASDITTDAAGARERLDDFLADMGPAVNRLADGWSKARNQDG